MLSIGFVGLSLALFSPPNPLQKIPTIEQRSDRIGNAQYDVRFTLVGRASNANVIAIFMSQQRLGSDTERNWCENGDGDGDLAGVAL